MHQKHNTENIYQTDVKPIKAKNKALGLKYQTSVY
jgi:hypothetical protein